MRSLVVPLVASVLVAACAAAPAASQAPSPPPVEPARTERIADPILATLVELRRAANCDREPHGYILACHIAKGWAMGHAEPPKFTAAFGITFLLPARTPLSMARLEMKLSAMGVRTAADGGMFVRLTYVNPENATEQAEVDDAIEQIVAIGEQPEHTLVPRGSLATYMGTLSERADRPAVVGPTGLTWRGDVPAEARWAGRFWIVVEPATAPAKGEPAGYYVTLLAP